MKRSSLFGVSKFLIAILISGPVVSPAVAQTDTPWRKLSMNSLQKLEERVRGRTPLVFCKLNHVVTQSPLDKVTLPAVAVKEYTPALAQAAGFISMVAPDQRDVAQQHVIERLHTIGAWSPAAEEGYFTYLLSEADTSRQKADAAINVIGNTVGALATVNGADILNEMTGTYTGSTLSQAMELAKEHGTRLLPTTFAINPEPQAIAAVVDALLDHPCEISATDAIIALRIR